MKLTVTQENLHKALQNVARVASAKTPLPILNNIILKTSKNRLLLAATNLEIAVTHYIGAKVESEGALTIPARLFSEFISNLPKGNIELETKDQHLTITLDHYTSTIHGMGAEEFPELPVINEANTTQITLPTTVFKRAISQTILASSHDSTRPMLTGAYFHTQNGELYLAATDGYRLAERKLIKSAQPTPIAAIIPVSSLQELVRITPDEQEEITILIDENQVRFRLQDIEVTSKLIEATFVDYRQLIPQKSDITVVVDKDEFSRITKVASLFARESAGGITIKTDPASQTVSIHSIASQLGENTSEADVKVDNEGSVTLNSRYLLEALGCIDSPEVSFSFSGKLAPCVLKASGKTDEYQHIIMPLKS
jgi:DNA polymerase-3 subunit beta